MRFCGLDYRFGNESEDVMTETQNQMAAGFRALHAAGNLLVLPNAWDVASARIVEDCGAAAIATSSAAVAWANGYPDGEALPKERLPGLVADIVRVAKVPVTADSEAGYDASPEDVAGFVVRLAKAGAVGINLEDGADRRRSSPTRSARSRRHANATASTSSSTPARTSI